MGDQGMAYVPRPDDVVAVGARAAPLDHVQRRFLHAGRILVTGGCLVLTYTTIGNTTTNAEHALVGLALLLLGVFMIMLSTVANQFLGAARVGAAVADAVLFYFFAPAQLAKGSDLHSDYAADGKRHAWSVLLAY
ncbi:hypothetical protein BAE44_0007777 [Dichanthelium oligosanthes]|uniref:Uncharacterized protein n=1 Tax=Dichanthelium oligosanthes TaxID=888268 RepID=A0A1E5W1E6_9POAL|nr:hypothetical protein BAE44_0007777 [Dichanthelium oligosanthes]